MLPTIVLTVASFLMIVDSSPVYNMQPAYITSNIGTTGRNIRNLPCISRKTNQNGVCMFAIDCLKANGTHLGTCIDRFYFGSCCHIEPVEDVIDNSIEPVLFPEIEREPPIRLETTEKIIEQKTNTPIVTTEKLSTILITSTSFVEPSTVVATTTKQELREPITPKITTVRSTTTTQPTTVTTSPTTITQPTAAIPTTTMTHQPIITTIKNKVSTRAPIILTKEPSSTEINEYKLTTFQSVEGNEIQTTLKPIALYTRPISTSTAKILTKPTHVFDISSTIESITVSVPLVTRPPSSKKPSTTTFPPSTAKTPTLKVPTKPVTSGNQTLFKPTSRPTRPKPTQINYKPTNNSTAKPFTGKPKPSRSTQKPSSRPSHKPVKHTVKPNRKPTNTTRIPTTTRTTAHPATQRVTSLTLAPLQKVSTQKVPQSTDRQSTQPTVTTTPLSITSSEVITPPVVMTYPVELTPLVPTTPPAMALPETTSKKSETSQESTMPVKLEASTDGIITWSSLLSLQNVHLTTASPEISSPTHQPALETFTNNPYASIAENSSDTNEIESAKPASDSTTGSPLVTWSGLYEAPIVNTTDGDWVPITTPDGWILLPNVSSSTEGELSSPPSSTSASTSLPETSTTKQVTSSLSDKISETTTGLLETIELLNVTTSSSPIEDHSTMVANINGTALQGVEDLNISDYTNVCGRRIYPEARIVGGEKSSFGKWPWQISLRQWRTSTYLHKCGAALLSEHWAITAAHCVESVPPSDLLLRLGEYDLATESEPYLHQERRVQIVASHPQFDPRSFEYDLALLRFYEPVKFQPNILPVCVPQTDEDFIGRNAFVTGWGRLYEDGPLPNVLQEVKVPVINNTLCESMYRSAGYIEHIPHIFICAGWRRGGYDSCEGDSGGPMVIQREDKRFLLAGVISWGIGCAEANQPGVYTRISEFRDWINQILQF